MTLQLVDNLWELKINSVLDATIPNHYLGVFTNTFVVVNVSSTEALPIWKQGGQIGQAISFDDDFAYGEIKSLNLNSYLLFQFPLLTGENYELYYFSLPRLINVNLKIWEYKGNTVNASVIELISALENANLSNLQVDLPAVTTKLEEIDASIQYLEQLMSGTNNTGIPLSINNEGRLTYTHDSTDIPLANFADLENLEISTDTISKVVLQEEKTFYVRVNSTAGNNGETEAEAFNSIEEALIVLANKYEISGHLILDLDTTHTLNCWYLPVFTGSGQITFKGNNCTITFIKYQDSTQSYFSNWAALNINLESITFNKGECTKLLFEGGKLFFDNVDFGQLNVEFDNCRSSVLASCQGDVNSSKFTGIRSNLNLTNCIFIAEFRYCQLELVNCTFQRAFGIEASNIILRNPRINFRWYTVTASIINSTIEFKSSWLTFENPGGDPQRKPLISFQNCNLKDFPSNVDVQGQRTFDNVGVVKLINCQTPEEFNNVNYDFSRHTFINNACGFDLVHTTILKDLNIQGTIIRRDAFSILGGKNYDNSNTNIPAETLQEAIDYLVQLINN